MVNDIKNLPEIIESLNKEDKRRFNMIIQMRPIKEPISKKPMPYIFKIVDRRNPFKKGNDIGFMEMYGTPVIGSDPFKVAHTLKEKLANSLKNLQF